MVNRINIDDSDFGGELIGSGLSKHLKPEPTNEIDRRTLLRVLGVLGITASAGSSISRSVKPMPVAEIVTRNFVLPENQSLAISHLTDLFSALISSSRWLDEMHQKLFVRRVIVEWDELTESTIANCTGVGKDRQCDYETVYEWVPKSASEVVYADDYLDGNNQAALARRLECYGAANKAIQDFSRRGLLEVRYDPTLYRSGMSDEELASSYGFEWKDSEVTSNSKGLIAAAIAVPMTTIGFYYNQVADFVKNTLGENNFYRPTRKEEEHNLTRRSFMLALTGAGVGGVVTAFQNNKQKNDAVEIVEDGKSQIRDLVKSIQMMHANELFMAHTNFSWRQMMTVLDDHITSLELVNTESVTRAVEMGLIALNNAHRRCWPSSVGTRRVRTTLIEDSFSDQEIETYVLAAENLKNRLQDIRGRLAEVYSSRVLETISPAMRASYLTDKLELIADVQEGSHLKGLAWDLSLMYGSIYGIMFMSEFAPELNKKTYSFVQRIFDAVDRMRMETYDVFSSLKESSKGFYSKLVIDKEIDVLLNSGITSIAEQSDEFVRQELVSPLQPEGDLLEQIESLQKTKIIEYYFNKALTYFANKRMTASDTVKTLFTEREFGEDAVKDIDFEELKGKVLSLMQSSIESGNFFMDLLNAGLIDDGYDDQLWFQVPRRKLDRMISNKAARLSALFASMQSDWVSLGILPVEWSMAEVDSSAEILTGQDFIDAVEKMIIENMDSAEVQQAFDKLYSVHGRAVCSSIRSKYLMLKSLNDYLDVGANLFDLLVHIPHFKNAINQVAGVSADSDSLAD